MVVTGDGNVGIGTASPTRSLQIERGLSFVSGGTSNNSAFEIVQTLGTNDYTNIGQHRAQFRINNRLGPYTNRSLELALLDSGTGVIQANAGGEGYFPLCLNPAAGKVGIGLTDPQAKLHIFPGSAGAFMIGSLGATEATAPMVMRDAGNEQIHFYYSTTKVGSITSTSTSTAFNTSSDYRLKENIMELTSALDRVNEISVYQFNFISEPTRKVNGFIAHELQSIIPEAVTGVKDEMIEFGVVTRISDGTVIQKDVKEPEILDEGTEWSVTSSKPNYQGVDQSKLVPLLTRSIQELSIKNDTLETQLTSVLARLDALENA
jgi:hypothetical protein